MKIRVLAFFLFTLVSYFAFTQDKSRQYKVTSIGFWNVENLYDTLNDPLKEDDEFTPEGANKWTGKRYKEKLERMSEVISKLGTEINPDGLSVMGFAEIENAAVLKDLIQTQKLKSRNYQIVHYDSPDRRGVDVGFIYNPKYFTVSSSKNYAVNFEKEPDHKTRDILRVSGKLDGENFHFLICHWPSRRGGEKRSRPGRITAAKVAKAIIDSIQNADPNAKIMLMGDLNDDPINYSVKGILKTSSEKNTLSKGQLFNAFEEPYQQGIGSLAYNDVWNLFDQIIITPNLVDGTDTLWQYKQIKIFNDPMVKQDFGNFKGYPFRTYAGGNYQGGYSDHFSVYMTIIKSVK